MKPSSAATPIRLLVVDDAPLTREKITELLLHEDDIVVVGYAENGIEAIKQFDALLPDVMTIDTHMPFGYKRDEMSADMQLMAYDGIAAMTEIRKRHPDAKIIVSTVHNEADTMRAAMSAGALKYILEPFNTEVLASAIREVARS